MANEHHHERFFWGILLTVAGVLLLLDALGIEIASKLFWAILLIIAGGLLLIRALSSSRS